MTKGDDLTEYEALAKTVIRRSLQIRPKENVIIETWNHGLPIAAEFVYQLRAHGARPLLFFEDEAAMWRGIATLPKSKLGQVGAHEWKAMGEADAYIFITGPADITKIRELGRDKWDAATAYNDEWYRRARRQHIRGARIGLGYVTEPRARAYGFDLDAWRQMMLEASAVDPREIVRRGRKLATALSRRGRLEITAPNGTQFSCDLIGREAGIEDGVVTKKGLDRGDIMTNIPAGEVYVAPDEKSAEGTIVFDRRIPYLGRWIHGVSLAFDGGRLVKWTATENAALLQEQWDEAKGDRDRDRFGFIDIGLNPKARPGFLQDVIVAGNVYIAIGENEDVGGKNKTDFYLASSISDATVRVNGQTIVKHGSIAA